MTTAVLMDGRELAGETVDDVRARAARVAQRLGRKPCLATVLIGDDPASETYVRMKQNPCQDAGIASRHVTLAATTSTAEAVATVQQLSADDGILVQHPAPSQIDEREVLEAIAPGKDVDGVTYASFSTMSLGGVGFESCTPSGIIRLLAPDRITRISGRRYRSRRYRVSRTVMSWTTSSRSAPSCRQPRAS